MFLKLHIQFQKQWKPILDWSFPRYFSDVKSLQHVEKSNSKEYALCHTELHQILQNYRQLSAFKTEVTGKFKHERKHDNYVYLFEIVVCAYDLSVWQ